MFLKTILLISILVAGVAFSGELFPFGATPEDRGTVFVHVVYRYWGFPLKDAEITLTKKGADGKLEDIKKFSSYTIKDIPYGKYTLDVWLRGCERESREIVIDQPESWVTVGMRLGQIAGPNSEPLGGRILQFDSGSNDNRWVRLASLYSDLILEAAVDRSSGEFSFTKVPYGSYILLTLSGGKSL